MLALCAAVAMIVGPGAGAAPALWQPKMVPAVGGVVPLALSFDARGDGLLAWVGNPNARPGSGIWAGSSVRSPAGTWSQGPPLPFYDFNEQLYMYGAGRSMLVGSRAVTTSTGAVRRVEVLYADGSADGTFGAVRVLDGNGSFPATAVDSRGDAIIAWADAGGLRVLERNAAGGLGAPIALPAPRATYGSLAVALDVRGDQVLAWLAGNTVAARVRDPRGSWGPATTVARLPGSLSVVLRAAVSPSGTVVLAWESTAWPPNEPQYSPGTGCDDCPTVVHAGIAEHAEGRPWRAFTIESTTLTDTAHGGAAVVSQPAIVPLVESSGSVDVVWTGGRGGAPVVKLARVRADRIAPATLPAGAARGPALTAAVAGPGNALLVLWSDLSAPAGQRPIDVSLRRGEGAFAAPVALPPAGGSAVAGFDPESAEAVVVIGGGGAPAFSAYVNSAD